MGIIKRKIVTGIEDQSYDTYLREAARQAAARFNNIANIANEAYTGIITSEKKFQRLCKIAATTPHNVEKSMESKAEKKYIFRQGGSYSKQQLVSGLGDYFETVHCDQDPTDDWVEAAQYLAYITHMPDQTDVQLIETSPRRLFNCYKGDHRSFGGLTYLGDRRDYPAQVAGISQAIASPYNIDPTIAGMVLKDSKYRNIFMDSFANYYREAMFLYRMFERWHAMPFDSNQGDERLAYKIITKDAQHSYGGDYEAMDKHHSFDATYKLLTLIMIWFRYSTKEIKKIQFWIEDLFEQSVVVCDELWTPEEYVNFLSGLFPTHDLEGMENTLILTRSALDCSLEVSVSSRKLRANQVYIVVCGDDSIVLFGKGTSTQKQEQFKQAHQKRAAEFGQIVKLEKVEESDAVAFFCKKAYALRYDVKGYKQGANVDNNIIAWPKYSLMKTINCLYHPLNYPTWETASEKLLWFCSVYDNAYGDKMWKAVLKNIVDQNQQLFTIENINALLNMEELPQHFESEIKKDWWMQQVFDKHFVKRNHTVLALIELLS